MATSIFPTYSHGGVSAGGFPVVVGNTTNAGRPVYIGDAISTSNQLLPGLIAFFAGTSITFLIEGNGGQIDSTGNPPTGEWIDVSNGGYSLTTGQSIGKVLPIQFTCYRTRITAIVAGILVSYVPSIITSGGVQASARYPKLSSTQSLY
jgi:hypothetical protein